MIDKIDKTIYLIEGFMMVSLTIIGLSLGGIQVILRYAFNTGFHWLEASLVMSLIWAMLFGASRAVRQGYHPRVDILAISVPNVIRFWLNLIAYSSALLLCLFYLYDSFYYAKFLNMLSIKNQELGVPELYIYIIIPVTMCFFSIRYVILLLRLGRNIGAIKPESEFLKSISSDNKINNAGARK